MSKAIDRVISIAQDKAIKRLLERISFIEKKQAQAPAPVLLPHTHDDLVSSINIAQTSSLNKAIKRVFNYIDQTKGKIELLISTEILVLRDLIEGVDSSAALRDIIRRIENLENRPIHKGGGGVGVDRWSWRQLISGGEINLHSHPGSGVGASEEFEITEASLDDAVARTQNIVHTLNKKFPNHDLYDSDGESLSGYKYKGLTTSTGVVTVKGFGNPLVGTFTLVLSSIIIFIMLSNNTVYADKYGNLAPYGSDSEFKDPKGTVAQLGSITGMEDNSKYTVTDGKTMTDCETGGGVHKVECCYDESEAEWEACHPGINPTAYPIILTTIPDFAGDGIEVGSDSKSINAVWDTETSDPCGSKSIGYHYLSSAGYPCYCGASNVDKKFSDDTDCAY